MEQIIRRTNGVITPLYKSDTIEDVIFNVRKEILEAIQDLSPIAQAEAFTNMKKGGPALRANMFVRAIRKHFKKVNLDYPIKTFVDAQTKEYVRLGKFRFAVSLISDKLSNHEISLIESANRELPTPEEYSVDAFIVCQINNTERELPASFSVITYEDIYRLYKQNSEQIKFQSVGRTVFRLTNNDINKINYSARTVEGYKHSKEHRDQIINRGMIELFEALMELSVEERTK